MVQDNVSYWLHAYTPDTLIKAQNNGHKEAYFYKEKSMKIKINDILICYLASDKNIKQKGEYSKFFGLLEVLTSTKPDYEKYTVSTKPIEPKVVLDNPKIGIRFDDERIWWEIQKDLNVKDGRAWGALVHNEEPLKLSNYLGKTIEQELKKILQTEL